MKDIVINLPEEGYSEDDLRYCLRSIERYVLDYNEIWIIGDLPDWVQGVIHVDHSPASDSKWINKNMLSRIMVTCVKRDLTEDFVFMESPFVFPNTIKTEDLKKYCKSWDDTSGSIEKMRANRTRKLLSRRGFKLFNCDTGQPTIFNKKKFMITFEKEHWETPYGYGINSIYTAINSEEVVPTTLGPQMEQFPTHFLNNRSSYEK